VFLLAITGLIELGMMMLVATLMEGGLREAARFGITGYHPPGSTRESYILDTIASNTIGLVDMENAEVTYLIYPSFGDIGKPEPFTDVDSSGSWDPGEPYVDINGNGTWDPDMGAAGLGGPGEVVLYTVAVDWGMLTPVVAPLVEDGKIRMTASVAVRNEPWPIAEGG
jgi:Flp pilus assembly protein TadG